MKIRIPAQTVEVDAKAYAVEYDIDIADVRADVQESYAYIVQQLIDGLGLAPEPKGETT